MKIKFEIDTEKTGEINELFKQAIEYSNKVDYYINYVNDDVKNGFKKNIIINIPLIEKDLEKRFVEFFKDYIKDTKKYIDNFSNDSFIKRKIREEKLKKLYGDKY